MSDTLENGIRIGSKTNPIVISLAEYKGHSFIDIRKCFVKNEDQSILPTRKGISLNRIDLGKVLETLMTERPKIEAWFDSKTKEVANKIKSEMQIREQACERTEREPHCFSQTEEAFRDSKFFTCESHGADDSLVFNSTHPLYLFIKESFENKEKTLHLLSIILSAYHRTKSRFSGDIELDADLFFKYFEHEWGLILSNYIYREKEQEDD